MQEKGNEKQNLSLKGREILTVDCVKNVLGFDESYVSLETDIGKLIIEGSELKIDSLTKNDRKVIILGTIDSICYSDFKQRKRGRFLQQK